MQVWDGDTDIGERTGFAGMRVLSLESRRAEAMEQTIRHHGGVPFVAPSVKEIPFEQHDEVYRWAERLFAGEFHLMVLMTGAGIAFLRDILAERYPRETFAAALRRVALISRGPKPAAVLREMDVDCAAIVPEPNTWREVVSLVAARPERAITIQEYGCPNPELAAALEALEAQVTTIAIYRWALPDDSGPLREAARRIAALRCEVVLFTTSIQFTHLMQVAQTMGIADEVRKGLQNSIAVGSVGPVMNEALAESGIAPDIVPAEPKMALLVRTAAETAASVLRRKRRTSGGNECGLAETLSKR
jgi:uroporphyrinogen-III synthase